MFRNYLKVALRNIWRHKGYSFINIAGLAVGMACCILILLWVQDELSYDRFHENANQLHRIICKSIVDGGESAGIPSPFAAELKEEYPEVLNTTRYYRGFSPIKYKDKNFYELITFVDSSFFEMFSFPFIKGNPKTALSSPSSIVITEDMADKYFGNEEPLGKTMLLQYWDRRPLKVAGIIKNIPHNSHLQANFFVSFSYLIGLEWGWNIDEWDQDATHIYVLLRKNISVQDLNRKIYEGVKKHRNEYTGRNYLQPISRIHLYSSNISYNMSDTGDIKYVYIFSIIALFILLIACINFMNLTTARSSNRAKEIGMRKVVGAKKNDLIKQYLGESILLSFIALIFAIALVELFIPAVNNLLEKKLTLSFTGDIPIIPGLICIALLTGILSGSYPALFLSSLKPGKILKGDVSSSTKSILLRKILVVIQFSISIVVLICTIVIFKQLNHVRNIKLGFDKESLIYLNMRGDIRNNYETVKNELLQNPNIINVTASENLLFYISNQTSLDDWDGKIADERTIQIYVLHVDYDFLKTYKIEMAQGRFFSKKFSTDAEEAVVVNETAIKAMKINAPIGKKIIYRENNYRIIGVIKDFHHQSLHTKIEPLVMKIRLERFSYLTARIKSNVSDISGLITFFESIWSKYSPDYPLRYNFLNDVIKDLYFEDKQIGTILGYFAFLAIFISCLGLFGLASFTTKQRTKEIGIRKVLGATVSNILSLLTKDFVKWVLIANIIAWPIAYYAVHRWLQNFAYRTNIGIITFILSAALAMVIALLTVSYQALKAAYANPVETLRYE